MSLTFVPEKPFKPLKEKQKVIVSSLVCQFDPNNNKQDFPNYHDQQHKFSHLHRQGSIVPYRKSNGTAHDKSYRMQTGLKRQKSIVQTKKKRILMTKSKMLPNFTSRVKALKDHE